MALRKGLLKKWVLSKNVSFMFTIVYLSLIPAQGLVEKPSDGYGAFDNGEK